MSKPRLYHTTTDFELAMAGCDKQQLDQGVYQLSTILQKYTPAVQIAILCFYFTCILDLTGLSAGTVCGIIDGIRQKCSLPSLFAAWRYMTNEW